MTFPDANEALARAIAYTNDALREPDTQRAAVYAQLSTAWALIADQLITRQAWEQEHTDEDA